MDTVTPARRGALSYQELKGLEQSGALQGFGEGSFQPASVDLSLGEEIYRLRTVTLPYRGETIRDLLGGMVRMPHDTAQPLEPGELYLCRIRETVKLPPEFYAYTNPKSSTGRNDIQVRLLADGVLRFDTVPRGFSGELWLLISSKHFFVKLSDGDKLCQLRVFDLDTRLDADGVRELYEKEQLLWSPEGEPMGWGERKLSDHDGSLILGIDLAGQDIVGYKAKMTEETPVLDFSETGHNPDDFFDPVKRPKAGSLLLQEGGFYIFYTYERCRVPSSYAAEMVAMDERSGEFRSHYAGFIDPGWGYGRQGEEKGWPLVLEVRPFESTLTVRHNQMICKLKYEQVKEIPEYVYGETDSHYKGQAGALLSKHFRP